MHNQLKVAIVVEAIVLAIAIAFSICFFAFGWYESNQMLGVLLFILWVLAAAVLILVFRVRSLEREEMLRRFYISQNWIYNHEIGYAPLSQIVPDGNAYEFVTFAAESLARMSYGFEVASTPENFKPDLLISSIVFKYHLVGEDVEDDEKSVVIDSWKGSLKQISTNEDGSRTYTVIGTYGNARELAGLLIENETVELY